MSARQNAIAEIINSAECPSGVPKGWQKYVILGCEIFDAAYPGWSLSQVKEKFGGLRFYINYAPFEPNDWVKSMPEENQAEHEKSWYRAQEELATAIERACAGKCEVCGKPGEQTDTGWIHTLCPEHTAKYLKKKTMRGLNDA